MKPKRNWNADYKAAVLEASAELFALAVSPEAWQAHAEVIITKHLTPLLRDLLDEAKAQSARK